jgi:hypothetical protein
MDTPTTGKKRIFPSMPAAIVVGALVIPLHRLGWKFIETTLHDNILLFVWLVVSFFIPVLLATGDLKYWASTRRERGSNFVPSMSADDFRLFYIPAWKRMFVLFVSAGSSGLLLNAFGIRL